MTQRRCRNCREWYDKKLDACPACDKEAYGFNKALHAAKLNNHLYQQAQRA